MEQYIDEICTYEVCKLAKKNGFNEKCYHYYQKGVLESDGCFNRYNKGIESICSAPTQSLLQRWMRAEKNIHIEIVATACGYFWIADKTNGTAITDSDVLDRGTNEGGCFDTFELCLEDALKYILQNLV